MNPPPPPLGTPLAISESFRKYLSNVPGRHNVKTLYKTAIVVTGHMLQKVLMAKYKTFIVGNNITYIINCKHRVAAKLYTLETWFVRAYVNLDINIEGGRLGGGSKIDHGY